jgi:4-amino-4-deoxy-L-arabinose transferase-like glycosyltransferase
MTSVVAWIAAATTALHLATANLWGYHRDEFYYLACGRRLAWGFVDHPPVTPWLYRIADLTVGSSKLGLRMTPALLHGASVLLVASLARELGGSTRAQVLAASAAALAPLLLTTGHFLGTVTVEITVGVALALVVARLVNGGDPRLWLLAGALTGLGLLNKWTFAFGVAGLAVGLLVGSRDTLATPWLLGGIAIALALWAPNLWWQAQHGWPQLEFAGTLRDYGQTPLVLPAQLLLLGAGAILAVPGIGWLATNGAGRPYRFLLVAVVVATVLTLVTGGKPYYTAAVLPALLAAGAVAIDGSRSWVVPAVVVAVGVLLAPLAMPLTPRRTANALRAVNPELGEMVGWEQLAAQARVLHAQHPHAGILTTNYSEAGAIELLAPDVPNPASGHNSYWDWGPPAGDPDTVIVYGADRARLGDAFTTVRRIATVASPDGVHNQEDGTPVWLASGRRTPWSELWPRFRRV